VKLLNSKVKERDEKLIDAENTKRDLI